MRVSVLEAKTHLSEYMKLLESGQEEQITIERYGKPAAKLVMFKDVPASKRIGVAKGKLKSPKDLDKFNDEIAVLFGGDV